MKCPKCGFVSYAGLEQCKKCGYSFEKATREGIAALRASFFPQGVRSIALPPSEPLPESSEDSPLAEPELPTQPAPPSEMAPVQVPSYRENLAGANHSRGDEQPQDWREELSERVENFRRRRARLQPDADPEGNLELDFKAQGKPEDYRSISGELRAPKEKDSDFDMEFGESTVDRSEDGEALWRGESGDETMRLDSGPADVDEMSLGEPVEKSPPMEILVGSPTETAPAEAVNVEEIYLAPLVRRFLAGLTDALVLVLGAAVFGMIFWRFCGRVSLGPLNITVLGLVAVILIFAYFAVFTAIASATPGLLWMGCEIRNLVGGYATVNESFWRAFGVLVSLSALMLGFVWACVDSDGLTWHDRMSGTVITVASTAPGLDGLKAET